MMYNRRLCITGSRHWTDEKTIEAWLERVSFTCVIIHGACPRGVDRMVDEIARRFSQHLEVVTFPVVEAIDGPWPAAGCVRNGRMLDQSGADRVWAFRAPGKSSGTDDCVKKALARGIPVTTIPPGAKP